MIKNEITTEADRNGVIFSYTLTETKKKALINISRSIKVKLNRLRFQTNKIRNKQHELNEPATKKNPKWKRYLKADMAWSIEQFNKEYSELRELCADLGELLKPKKHINEGFPKLLSFANKMIDNNGYRMRPNSFKYADFLDMIEKFSDCIDRSISVLEMN